MKKKFILLLLPVFLQTGCTNADIQASRTEQKEKAYSEGYYEGYCDGFEDGLYRLETTFDEEIAPSYNFLQEAFVFYSQNVCVIYNDNNKYHAYASCWDLADSDIETLMFVDDAIARGYTMCDACYNGLEYSRIPNYSYFVKEYEPELVKPEE